jgi:hypothetical protein
VPAPLTVILGATHDSEDIRPLARRLEAELAHLGGELLIADGTREGIAGMDAAVHLPGADVFTLRAAAARAATGDIVAFTEDHCVPADGWCGAVVAAHARHRDQACVAGCVTNGSGGSAMDWANFLMTFAPFLPGLPPRTRSRVAPAANVSFKAAVLHAHELRSGFVELELLPHLQRDGQLVYDDSVRVDHVQPRGRREALGMHFHNGRASASLPRQHRPATETLRRLAQSAALPPRLLAHVLREVAARRAYRRVTARAFPMLVVLAVAHAAGEWAGLLLGPGRSPERLDLASMRR